MRWGGSWALSVRNTLVVDVAYMIRIVTNRKIRFHRATFLMIPSTTRATVVSTRIVVALLLALIVIKKRCIAEWCTEFNALVVVKLTSRIYTKHWIFNS